MRKWRKEKGSKEKYKEEKKLYKDLCNKKRKEENEEWIERTMKAPTESQVWEVINRESVVK